MELLVREETFEFMDTVCSAVFTAEAETEKIIPDALDDVVEVVCTDAVLLLRGKEVSGGKVSVAGAADICVICRTESGVVSSLQVELPFTVSGDAPMATENSAITADLSLVSCGVHLINPRKLTVKITAAADVSCFEKQRLTVPVGITGLDDIETLSKTVETVTAADAFEKVFAVNEDFTLPSVKPELGEILSTSVRIFTDETKPVGTKLIVRGTITASAVYMPADSREADSVEFTIPFSQIVETDIPAEEMSFRVNTALTDASLIRGGTERSLSMDIHAVAQCVAYSKKELSYITDAYSTKYELNPHTEKTSVVCGSENTESSGTLRCSIPAQPAAKSVVTARVRCGEAAYGKNGDGGSIFTVPAEVTVLYIDDSGVLRSASGKYEVSVPALSGAENAKLSVEVPKDVYATVSAQGIDVKAQISVYAEHNDLAEVSLIRSAEYNEEAPFNIAELPSVTMHRTVGGETLWELAKRCRSSAELISAANSLEAGEEPTPGTMLIIPKKRA